MPLYEVTSLAGKEVATKRHDGPGSVLSLTESQAKYELLKGALKPYVPANPPKSKARG